MEKIELFLYDIFGNFIPGCILNFLFFNEIERILRINKDGVKIDSSLNIWIFFISSYILGNFLNRLSSKIFSSGKIWGITNNLNNDKNIKRLKKQLKYDGNDVYDIAKKYVEKSKYPNLIRKFEAKYLLYRNLTLSLFLSYFYTIFLNSKVNVLPLPFIGKTQLIATLLIITTFLEFKYYWNKTKDELIEVLILIENDEFHKKLP